MVTQTAKKPAAAAPEGVPITPTVGRIVWYYPNGGDNFPHNGDKEPLAAIIVKVHSDLVLNLAVFDANGFIHQRQSLYYLAPNAVPAANTPYWCWIPFQLGQAAMTQKIAAEAGYET